jgi:hypothetical protein
MNTWYAYINMYLNGSFICTLLARRYIYMYLHICVYGTFMLDIDNRIADDDNSYT